VKRLGIVAAMPQEFDLLASSFIPVRVESVGPRSFLHCVHQGLELVLVVSKIGKVSAAATTTLLIDRYGVDAIAMTGVAGGIGSSVRVGDLVLADALIQHDLDCKGVLGLGRFVVPSLGVDRIAPCKQLGEVAKLAAQAAVSDSAYRVAMQGLSSHPPKLHVGVIGSGDQFVSDSVHRAELVAKIPELLAVEMEGAAVGQVCAEHGVPFVVARVISDTAQGEAAIDFNLFVERAAAVASQVFIREFIERINV
jgi:adenosylhomocysteine nucleosidase